MTNFHGDDFTYSGRFDQKNPVAFFGFSSLAALVRFVEAIPASISESQNYRRNRGWHDDASEAEWFGTKNMGEALALARDGWPEGVELAREVMEFIEGETATRRLRTYGVAGGRVNVGRMLSGHPLHMRRREAQPARKNVTVFVETGMAANVGASDMIIRAALAAAICDTLEKNGYSAELVTVSSGSYNDGRAASQIAVTLKHAGEKLNINDVVFALGHPSYLRRLEFACLGYDRELQGIWTGMGRAVTPCKATKTEFVIGRIPHHVDNKIRGRTVKERARSILSIITQNSGLPIAILDGGN
jgi:hypothetical protein